MTAVAGIRQFLHAWWLVLREIRTEPRMTLCFVFAFVGAALPLILLFALKQGAIGTYIDELIANPRHREIIAVGAGSYDRAFISAAQAIPGMAFFVGDTRNISARLTAVRNPASRAVVAGIGLLPTDSGDPLYTGRPPDWAAREVILSTEAAQALGVAADDRVEGYIERTRGDRVERASVMLSVVAVAPPENLSGRYMLAPLPLLEAVESFLDDPEVTLREWLLAKQRSQFASFRAYANSIHELEDVVGELTTLGAKARIRSDDAAALLALDRALARLYWIVAACGTAGFFLALAASLRANLERQRPIIGLLRLLGAPPGVRVSLVFVQAITIVSGGLIVTLSCYFLLSAIINFLFNEAGTKVALAELGLKGVFATIGVSFVCALGAAAWSAREATQVQCQDCLRGTL